MEFSILNNPLSIILDFIIFISIIIIYYIGSLRSIGENEGFFDVELLVRNTEALITATSILLPGTLVAIDIIRGPLSIPFTGIFYASLWFLISILIGVLNIFRLPTVMNDRGIDTRDKMDRVQMRDTQSMMLGLAQLLAVLIGSIRVTITFVIN